MRTQVGRGKASPNPSDSLPPHSPIPCQITSGSGAGGSRWPGAGAAQDPGRRATARSHKQLGDAILARSCDRSPPARTRRLRGRPARSTPPTPINQNECPGLFNAVCTADLLLSALSLLAHLILLTLSTLLPILRVWTLRHREFGSGAGLPETATWRVHSCYSVTEPYCLWEKNALWREGRGDSVLSREMEGEGSFPARTHHGGVRYLAWILKEK